MRKGIKNNKYPVVIPTVIYTGYSRWNTEISLMEKQSGENIKEREEIGMTPLMKMLLDIEYKGRKEGIKETVQKMLQCKESDDKIIKYTGISKKELKSIKEAL